MLQTAMNGFPGESSLGIPVFAPLQDKVLRPYQFPSQTQRPSQGHCCPGSDIERICDRGSMATITIPYLRYME